MTNNEIIELANEANRIVRALDETVRRLDSLAADIGARNKGAWTFPGVPGTGTVYEPPDQH